MIYLSNINLSQNELQNAVMQPLATAPSAPKLGQIYYSSVTHKLMQYDGAAWKTVGANVETSNTNGNIKVDGVEMQVYSPVDEMKKLVYDTNNNGVVDNAEKLGGQLPAYYAKAADVPAKLSQLTNDEGFVDTTVQNLVNYYTKSQVTELIGAISTLDIQVVQTLPTVDISTTTIYLMPLSPEAAQNVYEEYLYVNSQWEKIGTTAVDLSNYLQKTGDGSNTTVDFTQAATRGNIATGEKQSVLMGKIAKVIADLKTVAYTGVYADLTGKPPAVNHTVFTLPTTAATQTFTAGGYILGVMVVDNSTKQQVVADLTYPNLVTNTQVTVTLSEAPASALSVIVTYQV